VHTRTLVAVLLALSAGSFTSLFADGPCGEFLNLPSTPRFDPNCVNQTWLAWMTAGQNDPNNPTSNIWGGKFTFAYLTDGLPSAWAECRFVTFDKNGVPLDYSISHTETPYTSVSPGVITGFTPGVVAEYPLSSPLPPGAGFIGGPATVVCSSSDPAVLRNKIAAFSSYALYSPQGLKLAEISERVKFASSYRWTLPLVEGSDGMNWEHTGIAITNTTTRQKAPTGVTVRISIEDHTARPGPYRDITLNPPLHDAATGYYNLNPGETKVYTLWTLFGDSPVEGNALFAPYGNAAAGAQRVHGTVTVESLDPSTSISVSALRMFGETGLTAVPVSPFPAP
jgi:hypothetical protein